MRGLSLEEDLIGDLEVEDEDPYACTNEGTNQRSNGSGTRGIAIRGVAHSMLKGLAKRKNQRQAFTFYHSGGASSMSTS